MSWGISGDIGDDLEQILTRQLMRQFQQEQMQRQRQQDALALEDRAEERERQARLDARQDRMDARLDARDLIEALSPGEISEEQAGVLRRSPGTAARVTSRKRISGVRPIGMGQMDESAPEDFSVLEPTPEQARHKHQLSEIRRIGQALQGANDEGSRRRIASDAFSAGLNVPQNLLQPSLEEQTQAQARADEREFKQFQRRTDYQEDQLRNRPVRTPPPTRTEMTPGQSFNATRQLRNDFVRETSAAREVGRQLELMKSALTAARQGDMAAGSQGVLVTFQKILDPASVVRESEYARSAAGQSLLSRIEGAAERIARGGAGVPLRELEAFVSLAEQFSKNQMASADDTRQQIEAIAEEFGLNPSNITRDYGEAGGSQQNGASLYQQYLERRKRGGG